MRRPFLRRLPLAAALLLLVVAPLLAHDMFLRLDAFFVAPNTTVNVRLFNGTFIKSENSISPDRLNDIAIVSPTGRTRLDVAQWNAAGDTSVFPLRTGAAGTYVLGVSTKPRVLEMSGAEFNAYLASDGIPDELAYRRARKLLDERSKERYQKHVKALVQAGTTPSASFGTRRRAEPPIDAGPREPGPVTHPTPVRRRPDFRMRPRPPRRPATTRGRSACAAVTPARPIGSPPASASPR